MNEVGYTSVFSKNLFAFNSGVRRIVNKGGTSSSKTYSVIQLLNEISKDRRHTGTTISIVSESFPHLRLGAIRDFTDILRRSGYREGVHYTQANHVYTFGNSIVEFFSADSGKSTGPRRKILYLNECNNIPYSVVTELEQRTEECIFYDFNPVQPFWIEDRVLALPANEFTLIKSNVYDNEYCPDSIRREIELKASRDPNFKRIHIDVEYGIAEGLVFPNIELVDSFPSIADSSTGLDFGFVNDPSALINTCINDGTIYLDQLLYQTGMTNPEIISALKGLQLGRKPIVADSAEPKSIEEIRRAGFNIVPCVKGPDSIRTGIDIMKSYPIRVTKRSVDLIKEFRNYKWKVSRDGVALNIPIDFFNHGIDASRYAITNRKLKPKPQAPTSWVPSR